MATKNPLHFGAPVRSRTTRTKYGKAKVLVIIRAGSLDEAEEIIASDSMHSSGARDFTFRLWLMTEGTVTVKIRCSDGSRELV